MITLIASCVRAKQSVSFADDQTPVRPIIELSPFDQGRGQWKVATSENITVTVTSPGAIQVSILGRPEGLIEESGETALELKRIDTPTDQKSKFVTNLTLADDFAGEVWAEAIYPDGTKRQSDAVALTAVSPVMTASAPAQSSGGSIGTDESARSDKLTGGRLKRAAFKAGEPDIRITVNLPAFLLTLWQNGAEVKTYQIGIGRKDFPVPIGEREARQIIFNPNWIPPDSAWVRRARGVEPYERITASDPRNPLGKIKIPLGGGYLIHEAAKPSDIGQLVSHGCIRMLPDDLFDLAEKIISARKLPVTQSQLREVGKNTERLVVELDAPLLVDINYDLQVVEGGVLHLYPDVYDRGAFALESLRAELQLIGVDVSAINDQTLKRMLDGVRPDRQLVINVADIKQQRWSNSRMLPLVENPQVKARLAKSQWQYDSCYSTNPFSRSYSSFLSWL